MPFYRLYWYGDDGHIKHARNSLFASDTDALAAAQRHMARFSAVEVWEVGRMVGRVDAPKQAESRDSPADWREPAAP